MKDFVAHHAPIRIAPMLFISIGFVVLGLWMIGAFGGVPGSQRYSPAFALCVGWLCMIVFGLTALAHLKNFFDNSVQLRIGSRGLVWSQWSDQIIPWSEISEITTWGGRQQKALILHLKNPSLFPGRGLGAFLSKANRIWTGGDIFILLTGIDRGFDDVTSALDQFRNDIT